MQKIFGPFIAGRASLGLLVMRVFFGLGLAEHGYQKIQAGPFQWGNDMATMPMHLVIPPAFQGLATFAEFGGGLAMIFGLLTPLAMLGIIVTMGFAILKFHLARGAVYVFTPGKPDYEPAAHYLIAAVGLLLTGPGTLSLDALIFGRRRSEVTVAP